MKHTIVQVTSGALEPIRCKYCKRIIAFGEVNNGEIVIKCRGDGCKRLNSLIGETALIAPKGSLLEEILES